MSGVETLQDDMLSSTMSGSRKFHGLIKRPVTERLRNHISSFFDYIYTMAGSHRLLVDRVQMIWLLQLLVCACHPLDLNVWPRNGIMGLIMNVFSVLIVVWPAQSGPLESGVGCTLFVGVVVWAWFLYVCWVLWQFARVAKVSQQAVALIVVYVNVIMLCIATILAAIFGRSLVYAIYQQEMAWNIVCAALALGGLVIILMIEVCFVSTCLTFRPQVVHILYMKDSIVFHVSYAVYQALLAAGSYMPGIGGVVCEFVSVIPLCVMIYQGSKTYCWASANFRFKLLLSMTLALLATVIIPILRLINREATELVAFGLIIGIIALFPLTVYIRNCMRGIRTTDLKKDLLDQIEEDPSIAQDLTHDQMMNILVYGFENGHRICHNWSLFGMAVAMFPKSTYIAILYVRYAAIYPDDGVQLKIAMDRVYRMKKHSFECQVMFAQILFIMQQRERGFDSNVRKVISRMTEKTEKCKNQMRYIWECIMQRKTGDLEKLAETLKRNEEEIHREYEQLRLFYPNNSYVVSALATFLGDVLGQERKEAEYRQFWRDLKRGARAPVERTYDFAVKHMPNLPNARQHIHLSTVEEKRKTQGGNMSIASSVADTITEPQLMEKQSQRRYLESMVENVRLPVTRYGPCVMVFTVCLLVPGISVACVLVMHSSLVSSVLSVTSVCQHVALLEKELNQLFLIMFHFSQSSCGLRDEVTTIASACTTDVHKMSDQERVLDLVQQVHVMLENVVADFHTVAQISEFSTPVHYLLTPMLTFRHFTGPVQYYESGYSLQQEITFITAIAMRLTTLSSYDIVNTSEFVTFTKNARLVTVGVRDFSASIHSSLVTLINNRQHDIEVKTAGFFAAGIFVAILSFCLLSRTLGKQKKMVFDAFNSLSKSTISAIVTRLNTGSGLSPKDDEEEIIMTPQEENALLTFSMSHEGRSIARFWTGNLTISKLLLMFFVIASFFIMGLLIITTRQIAGQMQEMVPIFRNMPIMHTRYCLMTLYLLRAKAMGDPRYAQLMQDDLTSIFQMARETMEKSLSDFVSLRYGGWSQHDQGISGIGDGLVADITTSTQCATYEQSSEGTCVLLNCMSYDNTVSYIWDIVDSLSFIMGAGGEIPDVKLNEVVVWLTEISSGEFINSSLATAKRVIEDVTHATEVKIVVLPVAFVTIVLFVVACRIVLDFISSADTVQWFVHLLLFCDPETVLKSRQHFKILSNDFSDFVIEEQDDTSRFYETLMDASTDAVIFMENNLVVHSVNQKAVDFLKRAPEEMIGKELTKIFNLEDERVGPLRNFMAAVEKSLRGIRSPCFTMEVEVDIAGSLAPALFCLHAVNGNGEKQTKPCLADGITFFILVIKDWSARVSAKRQIKEEQEKIAKLKALALPRTILEQIESGETDLCFRVPKATFLYVDFVGFRQMCSEQPCESVLHIVEQLFKEVDRVLGNRRNMCKLKTLGGNCLAAAGVLDEASHPRVNTKEAVASAVDIINAAELLKIERGLNISVRTCVYTYGPVLAGVTDQRLPVFEVFGIPMLQIHEFLQTAPEMSVYIPDFVCDDHVTEHFVIKKGPPACVNGQTLETYLVKGYSK